MQNPTVIDCEYLYPQVACSFLLQSSCGSRAAIIETNTNHAVPRIVDAVKKAGFAKDAVQYIIVTHVHLDHAGGAAALLKHYPDALLVAHPRAARHLIDPSRLVASAKSVYGEQAFTSMYGTIEPAAKERVIIPEDNSSIPFGSGELQFLYTRGHANHHFVVVDYHTSTVFTGDSFGLAYPALQVGSYPLLFASSSPTDFDPDAAVESVHKIVETGVRQAGLTHFGLWQDMAQGSRQMLHSLSALKEILNDARKFSGSENELIEFCISRVREFLTSELEKRGIQITEKIEKLIKMDTELNGQGIAFPVLRERSKRS